MTNILDRLYVLDCMYTRDSDRKIIKGAADEIERLRTRVAELTSERDEADRRAGAAERLLDGERYCNRRHKEWMAGAKEEWGVDKNTSFGVVWEEAMAARARVAILEAALKPFADVGLIDDPLDNTFVSSARAALTKE